MKTTNNLLRRNIFVSAVQLWMLSVLGVSPCRLEAAVAGKNPVRDYTATITVSIGPREMPKKVLFSHALPVPAGREDYGIECARSYRVEVLIETDGVKNPVEHSAQIAIVGLGHKIPREFIVPRMTFADGQSCLVKTIVDNGDELDVKVAVSQSDPAK